MLRNIKIFLRRLPLWQICVGLFVVVCCLKIYDLQTLYTNGQTQIIQFNTTNLFTQKRDGSKQKVVILMTQCRSGSSFTGEIFSASDGTMYLYEPLLPYGMDCTVLEDRKFAFLSRILNCNFTGLQPEYNIGFSTSHQPDYGDCVSKGFCFPDASIGLLKGYAATCSRIMNAKSSRNMAFNPKSAECGFPLRDEILHQQCLNAPVVFTKITRACSLDQLQPVYDSLTKNGRNVYVIHLVRDPR